MLVDLLGVLLAPEGTCLSSYLLQEILDALEEVEEEGFGAIDAAISLLKTRRINVSEQEVMQVHQGWLDT